MSRLDSMAAAAVEAGAILMEEARIGMEISRKSSNELVTNADIRSEMFLRERLGGIEPRANFLGEETSRGVVPEPPFWIVDPLDGTNNYAHGFPMFSVSIAYWDGSRILCGCVYDPVRDECFSAQAGGGTRLNGRPVSCSLRNDLADCLVATGFPYHRREGDLGVDLRPLEYFLGRVQGVRRGGSAALDMSYVACGRLDGFFEQSLKPWDMAAGYILVTEAGGMVTAYEGGDWTPGSRGVVASGSGIHLQMRIGVDQVSVGS
ncbi:MAG: inositol monophosphatase [Candidatus Fermentibacteraceae bacterium]|nr:inositol monophosphatase [Candidatus Fermentibacteraceae bacterium]MBN2608953.1 inositol monophosphatase [Candidatus Fermentibacteraceae bacterium]